MTSCSFTGEMMNPARRTSLLSRLALRRMARFGGDQSGAALVEFAMALPIVVVVFGAIVEGSRMMMSYQAAIAGVRDATRYLARVVPANICTTGGSVTGYTSKLTTLVSQGVTGASVLPPGITITSVTPSYTCVNGTYRGGNAPVAQVTAVLNLTFPFADMLNYGSGGFGAYSTTITDRARVSGS